MSDIGKNEFGKRPGNVYPEMNLDIHDLMDKSKKTFDYFLQNTPEQIPFCSLVAKLATTQNNTSSEADWLITNAHGLVDINPIVPPVVITGTSLGEVDMSFVRDASNDLSRLGLSQNTQTLTENRMTDDVFLKIWEQTFKKKENVSLIDIASKVQNEYFRIVTATRLFQLTKVLVNEHAPKVPWFKHNAVYMCTPKNTSRENNGESLTLNDGTHLLKVKVYLDSDFSKLKSTAKVEEYYKDDVVVAAHESAHAIFDEEFGPLANETKKDEANVRRVLTEGIAIEYENLMGEILDKIVPTLPNTLNYGPQYTIDRIDNVAVNADHPKFRKHNDGQILIDNLKKQLGILEKTREDQIVSLLDWLKKVDMKAVQNIFSSDDLYHSIINNPVNSLPMLEDVN